MYGPQNLKATVIYQGADGGELRRHNLALLPLTTPQDVGLAWSRLLDEGLELAANGSKLTLRALFEPDITSTLQAQVGALLSVIAHELGATLEGEGLCN